MTDLGITLQQTRSLKADVGTVAVKRNAAGHHLYVGFLQAGRRAIVTGASAINQGLNELIILSVFVLVHRR